MSTLLYTYKYTYLHGAANDAHKWGKGMSYFWNRHGSIRAGAGFFFRFAKKLKKLNLVRRRYQSIVVEYIHENRVSTRITIFLFYRQQNLDTMVYHFCEKTLLLLVD